MWTSNRLVLERVKQQHWESFSLRPMLDVENENAPDWLVKSRECVYSRGVFVGVALRSCENCLGIIAISAAIPEQQRARDVPFGGSEFSGENAAANIEPPAWIAQSRKR